MPWDPALQQIQWRKFRLWDSWGGRSRSPSSDNSSSLPHLNRHHLCSQFSPAADTSVQNHTYIKRKIQITFPEGLYFSQTSRESHRECSVLHISAEDREFINERSRKNFNCKNRTKYALQASAPVRNCGCPNAFFMPSYRKSNHVVKHKTCCTSSGHTSELQDILREHFTFLDLIFHLLQINHLNMYSKNEQLHVAFHGN